MVIEVTGAGKSSLCIFFFREEIFDAMGGQISVSAESISHYHTVCGFRIKFIDTPGFW